MDCGIVIVYNMRMREFSLLDYHFKKKIRGVLHDSIVFRCIVSNILV